MEGAVHWLLSGGWVRDKMRGEKCKDMDIIICNDIYDSVCSSICSVIRGRFDSKKGESTFDVSEEETRIVSRGNIVGRRLKIVRIGVEGIGMEEGRREVVEVEMRDMGSVGDIREDVLDRDFTVNGLYYHHKTGKVIDLCGGRKDVKEGVIRSIGTLEETFKDVRRMMRAVRFSVQKNMKIEETMSKYIRENGNSMIVVVFDLRNDSRRKTSWCLSTGEW